VFFVHIVFSWLFINRDKINITESNKNCNYVSQHCSTHPLDLISELNIK